MRPARPTIERQEAIPALSGPGEGENAPGGWVRVVEAAGATDWLALCRPTPYMSF
jgi:hypothetical protein